jgi:ATP-dependent Lon protease
VIISHLDVQVTKAGRAGDVRPQGAAAQGARFLSRQHEVLKVREKINSQVQEEMGRNQREYVLRQQLKAIKEELGEIDETGGDLDDFREKVVRPRCRPRPRRSRSSSSSG